MLPHIINAACGENQGGFPAADFGVWGVAPLKKER